MPRYRKLDNDPYVNVDGVRLWAGDDGWFDVDSGSRAEAVLLAGGAVSDASSPGSFTVASQAEAEAGTENTKGMTPLRTAQAIAALGGGGSTAISGGADFKLVTEEAYGGGVRIDTYTDDAGLIWDRNYNPDGSLNTETALGGLLVRTWSYTAGGLGSVLGAVRKSGSAYRVATADMASIKAELTALGVNCDAPAFWVHDFNNGLANGGLDVVWDKARACFRGPNRAPMLAYEWYGTVNVPNTFPSESGDLVTLPFPGWMAGPRTRFEVEAFTNDNSAGGCAMNFYMGGTIMYVVSDASAGRRTAEFMGRWWNNDSLTSQLTINPSVGQNPTSLTGGGGAGPNAFAATSIDTGAASVNVVLRITPTTADPAAVLRRAVLTLRN